MTRFVIVIALFVAVVCPLAGQPLDAKTARAEGNLLWYDVRPLGIEGRGWTDTKAPFDRLPAKAAGKVRDAVWELSRHSAGLAIRFVTDAPAIHARWTLTSGQLAMPHMPATGVSGLDLYYRADDGTWKWLGAGRPTAQTNTAVLANGIPPGKREYLLYLPLYNGVSSVEVGIPIDKTILKPQPRPRPRPVVFYGTSITQGGCASRPGMVHTAILGRRLGCPVINLGFSGNGRMEREVAELLAEIDAAVFVLDCLPNMTAKEIEERADPFVRILLQARPKTPILLVEDRSYSNSSLLPVARERNLSSRQALKKVYDRLDADKAGGVHYLRGDALLGDDGDGTVDGSHPTDLGFVRQADVFQKALVPLLSAYTPPPRPLIEGYTARISYAPGESVKFHVSCGVDTFDCRITRAGTAGSDWSKAGIPGKTHPIPENASSHGCRWPETFSVLIPPDCKSGYYTARLRSVGPDGKEAATDVPFVVRSARPGKDTKILLQLSTNTYNAYCNWGGYSLYAYNGRHGVQGRRVSFDRPIAGQFANWEKPFVEWAEKSGYTLDYAVNSDLEFHSELLKHYKLILSVGHDEYWSAAMRTGLEDFISGGGNVAFFSGNTCCWQVRSEDHGRALTCWKQSFKEDPFFSKGDHALLSTLWSHHLVKRPENGLTGVGFLHGGYHRSHGQFMNGSGAFRVHRPDHWLFAGTDLKRGAEFGGKDTIVGYECDGCEIELKNGLPQPTFRDGTPKTFQVLATAPARWAPDDCEWYSAWEKGRTGNAVLGVYQRGGTVVTVGTTDWAHGLRGNDAAVVRITKNILDRLSK